jgi:putative photosynthetic complex assembly protein
VLLNNAFMKPPLPEDRVVTDRAEPQGFPLLPLAGAGVLVIASILIAASARIWDVGTTRLTYTEPASTQELRFEDRADGSIAVLAADDGRIIELIEPGTKGFVRMVMRGLARDRQAAGIGSQPPFTLTRWADGRLSISDPTTARRIELTGFGADNVNAFAGFLPSGRDAK